MKIFDRTFFISVLGWAIAIGLYLLIYLYGTDETYEWSVNTPVTLAVWVLASFISGFFYWITILIADTPRLRHKSYIFLIIFKTLMMVVIIVFLHLLGRYVAYLVGSIDADQIWSTFLIRMSEKNTQVFILYVMIASFVLSFGRQMSEMTGYQMLIDLVLGRYYHPKDEDRIFMFLDMKDSTTIAEELGHTKFSQLVQECFHDMTGCALKYEVEIYHYEGDEVILTWPTKKGIKDFNCIRLFFDFTDMLKQKSSYYINKYGAEPHFKAGISGGIVTVIEIGDLKREVSYLSDVLNVGDRVQHKCNEFHKELLVCGNVYKLLSKEDNKTFEFEDLGFTALKGRRDKVNVMSVTRKA
jgi:adenylate cyclase